MASASSCGFSSSVGLATSAAGAETRQARAIDTQMMAVDRRSYGWWEQHVGAVAALGFVGGAQRVIEEFGQDLRALGADTSVLEGTQGRAVKVQFTGSADVGLASSDVAKGQLLRDQVSGVALLKLDRRGVPTEFSAKLPDTASPTCFDLARAARSLPGVVAVDVDVSDLMAAPISRQASARSADRSQLGVTITTSDEQTTDHLRRLIVDHIDSYPVHIQNG